MTKKECFIKRGDNRWFDRAEVVVAYSNGVAKNGRQIVIDQSGMRYTFKDGICITEFNNPCYRVELIEK